MSCHNYPQDKNHNIIKSLSTKQIFYGTLDKIKFLVWVGIYMKQKKTNQHAKIWCNSLIFNYYHFIKTFYREEKRFLKYFILMQFRILDAICCRIKTVLCSLNRVTSLDNWTDPRCRWQRNHFRESAIKHQVPNDASTQISEWYRSQRDAS